MLRKLLIGLLVVGMIAPFGVVATIMGRTLWAHASGEHAYAEGQSGAVAAAGEARTACPFGLVNDPYPGACRRYVDRNGNGICDLSETPAANGNHQDAEARFDNEEYGRFSTARVLCGKDRSHHLERRGRNHP